MRWIARVFAAAIIRRIAIILVALALGWCAVPRATAAEADLPCRPAANCDQGAAMSAAVNSAAYKAAMQPSAASCQIVSGPTHSEGGRNYNTVWRCSDEQGGNLGGYSVAYFYGATCQSRPDWNGPYPYLTGGKPKNGSVTCNGGCRQAWYSSGDGYFVGKYSSVPGSCSDYDDNKCKAEFGSGYYWNSAMSACEPEQDKCPGGAAANSLGECKPEPCPAGMTQQADGTCKNKENECPAGQVKSPAGNCLPGDGQCAAGEVRGKDGTCKKDADGDGEPDPGEEGEGPNGETADDFSGGDSCNEPPSCSGSPIMCGQARIQWRIDCNTRKNRNIAGGMCTQPPICTGEKCDALEYNSLLMQWRTACATEKLAASSGSGNGSNPDLVAIRNAVAGTGGTVDPGTGLPGSGAWQGGQGSDPIQPDTSGYGWGGGSCPAIPAIDVMGATIQFDPTPLCNWLGLGSYFVMGLAALASLRIVAGKDS